MHFWGENIMETITVDHSRKNLFTMVVLGLLMFGVSIWLLYAGLFMDLELPILGQTTSFVNIVVGGMGTLFFGYAFFQIIFRAFFTKSALIITDEGIINNTNAVGSKQIIYFNDMKQAKIEVINEEVNIGLDLTNEEEYLNSLPFIKRKLQTINKNNFGTSVVSMSVPHDSRDELEEIVEIINERIEKVQNR